MKKKVMYIVAILFFVFLTVGYAWIELGRKEWEYLEPDSIWKYENVEEQFFMVLKFDERGEASLEYINGDKKGEWIFGISPGTGVWKNMDFIKSEKEKSITIWTGKGKITPEKIIIRDIEKNEYLENDIGLEGEFEDIADETIPDGIEKIELERVDE